VLIRLVVVPNRIWDVAQTEGLKKSMIRVAIAARYLGLSLSLNLRSRVRMPLPKKWQRLQSRMDMGQGKLARMLRRMARAQI
jgi:hypothetical protein